MLLLNYAHPLTPEQYDTVVAMLGAQPEVRTVTFQADRSRPVAEVARELADAAELTPDEWQSVPLLLNPVALAPLTLALVAEIHGRSGTFPAIVNIRPLEGSLPTRYEVAEIVNLHAIRMDARTRRG